MPEPRPLYGLCNLLDVGPNETVVVVEGERCVDTLTRIGITAVTSSGGASAPQKSGWELLVGRRVVLIPDCDEAGFGYVREVARILARLDPRPEIRSLDLSRFVDGLPEGADIADVIEDPEVFSRIWGDAAEPADVKATIQQWLDQAEPIDRDGPSDQVESIDRDGLSDQVESQHERSRILIYPKQSWRAAKTFVERFFTSPSGERLLVFWQGEFFIWSSDAGFWRRTSEEEIKRRILEFLSRAGLLIKKEPEEVCVNAPTTSSFCADILGAVRSLVVVPDSINPPCWLDPKAGDPSPESSIVVKNGILDAMSGTLVPHSPRLFCVNRTDVLYDATAPEPKRWLQFLDELWGDDHESAQLLQEWFGHCLVDDLEPQKFLYIFGPSGSGKGVIAATLIKMVGEDAVACPAVAALATNFGLQNLTDKKAAIFQDARFGRDNLEIILERLLTLTAGDRLSVPRKFLPDWTGRIPARVTVVSNELPTLPDTASALSRRMLVLKTTRSFVGTEDFGLARKLEGELSGILNWSIQGLRRLRANGKRFSRPSYSSEIIGQITETSSPVMAFVLERCEVGPDFEVPTDVIYNEFKLWAADCGRDRVPNVGNFSKMLRAAVPGLSTLRESSGGRRRWFLGIRIQKSVLGVLGPSSERKHPRTD
jgi:putative DNA primase/helicase